MATHVLSSVDWTRHGPQNIDVDPAHRTEAIAALNCEAAVHGASIAILPTPWAHTVRLTIS